MAIVLSALLIRKFFFQPTQNPDYRIAANARLSINGINWADSDRTVLVALSKEYKYCSASAEFYRRLAAGIAKQSNTRLIMLFSEKESEAEAYLEQLDVPVRELRQREAYAINHRDGARNIPLDELPVRAQNELPLDQTIVIYGSDPSEADLAYSILDAQGFAHVLILALN